MTYLQAFWNFSLHHDPQIQSTNQQGTRSSEMLQLPDDNLNCREHALGTCLGGVWKVVWKSIRESVGACLEVVKGMFRYCDNKTNTYHKQQPVSKHKRRNYFRMRHSTRTLDAKPDSGRYHRNVCYIDFVGANTGSAQICIMLFNHTSFLQTVHM